MTTTMHFRFSSTLGQEPVTIKASYEPHRLAPLHSPPDDGDIYIVAVLDEHGQDVIDYLDDDDVERIRCGGIEHLRADAWA